MTVDEERAQIAAAVNAQVFPSLGDDRKRYQTELSEPELNALAGVVAFVKSACAVAGFTRYWAHYGPTLEKLMARLGREIPDDCDCKVS